LIGCCMLGLGGAGGDGVRGSGTSPATVGLGGPE
jgi:hypothetical protein